jgi:hypothetical protein
MHGSAIPDPQTPTLPPRAAEGPGGSDARSRREIQRNIAARSGFEPWTRRCARCGDIRGAQAPTDPMSRKLAMPVLAFGAETRCGYGPDQNDAPGRDGCPRRNLRRMWPQPPRGGSACSSRADHKVPGRLNWWLKNRELDHNQAQWSQASAYFERPDRLRNVSDH